LYDLGLVEEENFEMPVMISPLPVAHYIPKPSAKPISGTTVHHYPLPHRLMTTPRLVTARAAKLSTTDPYKGTVLETFNKDGSTVEDYNITIKDVAQIYISPHSLNAAFEDHVDHRRYDDSKHAALGLCLTMSNSCLILDTIDPSTPCALIPKWHA